MDQEVKTQSSANLAITEMASTVSQSSALDASVTGQELAAQEAAVKAEDVFELGRPFLPDATKAREKARMSLVKTETASGAVQEVLTSMNNIASEAALSATEAVMRQVEKEAQQSAEAAAKAAEDWRSHRAEKVAENVAKAMQPYHLAMLRAQKAVAATHAKAMSAAETSLKLSNEAQELAAKAQGMQSAGLGVQAQQLMMMAHGTMTGAANLKGWSEKLYNLANKINRSIGYWQLQQSLAATAAAASTPNEPPMALPSGAPA